LNNLETNNKNSKLNKSNKGHQAQKVVTLFSFHREGKCPGDLLRAVARSEAVGAQMVMEDDGLKLGTP